MIPEELVSVKCKGANMGGFVPLLYSLATDYRNGQKGLRTILEIGVRWGTSTLSFLYGLRDRTVKHSSLQLYSVDVNDCSSVVPNDLQKYWTFIHDDSKKVAWDKEIDILLIDGDHSYEGVKSDWRKYEPFVKKGGIILLHDVLWFHKPVIKFFWDEIPYQKSVLPLSKSGMGIVYKTDSAPYSEEKIRWDHKGIAQGK